MPRALLVGKVLDDDERARWFERGGKIVHRPSFHGWHYANAVYVLRTGLRIKIGFYCDTCRTGMLLDDWREDA